MAVVTCSDCKVAPVDPAKPPFLQSLCVRCYAFYRSTFTPWPAALTPPPAPSR